METLYRTLKDFFQSMGLPLNQDFELTIHRLHGLHGSGPAQAPAFRTNYYAFLLVTAGHSHYTIDNQEFECKAGTFYFTNPGHLKSFRIHEPLEGYMLTFSEEFVKQNHLGDFFQQFPFLLHETTPVMQLSPGPVKELSGLFEAMLHEYNGQALYKKAILTNQLNVLLYKTKELLHSHQVAVPSSGRAAELMGQFKALVNRNFTDLAAGRVSKILSIKELADRLNVHPNYLGNLVKAESGKPATEWIQARTLAEAQALLANTPKTVSEIAFGLGFTDATHFTKFFKKMVKTSPAQYRKDVRPGGG
jgi:AraC family transcriptional regulator, transcriptional activator of pobA